VAWLHDRFRGEDGEKLAAPERNEGKGGSREFHRGLSITNHRRRLLELLEPFQSVCVRLDSR